LESLIAAKRQYWQYCQYCRSQDLSRMGNKRANLLRVNKIQLDAIREQQGFTTRRALYQKAGWAKNERDLNSRLAKSGGWTEAEIVLLETLLECNRNKFLLHEIATSNKRDEFSQFEPIKSHGLEIFDARHIEHVYATINPKRFVWIFSADGFLEAEQERFLNIVSSAVERGIEIFYFFPQVDKAHVSQRAFARILEHFIKIQGENIKEKIKGFFISSEGGFLYAHSSRFVVIGTLDNSTRVFNRVMLFLRSVGGHWIEMPDLLREEFLAEMKRVIDPIEHRPIEIWHDKWRLPTLIQDHYRRAFTKGREDYGNIRDLVQTQKAVSQLASRISTILFQSMTTRRKPCIEWLDIGCEDGDNAEVAFNTFRDRGLNVSLTALETSHQTEYADILKYSVFLNGPEWSLESFVKKAGNDYRYDIITSIHSWYVIDPIYLINLYRLLQDEGVMAFIIAPFSGNIINQITSVVDSFIRKELKSKDTAYPMKVAQTDPYRNFAEDIREACWTFFGKHGTQIHIRKPHIRTEQFMLPNGQLTPTAKAVTDFFAHRMLPLPLNNEVYNAVAKVIAENDQDGRLFCEEWDIIVDKAETMRNRQDELFGTRTSTSPPTTVAKTK
jgi:hypothetical protein